MKMTHRSSKHYDHSVSQLKELMTAAPITIEHYSAIMRKRVEIRRTIEDALEEARMRRESMMDR
jgi:molybdopterin biosynthesis enzyme MoaB